MRLEQLTEIVYLDHRLLDILLFFGIILIGFLLRRWFSNGFSKLVYRFIPNHLIEIQDCIHVLRRPVEWLLFWIFFYAAIRQLHLPPQWNFKPVGEFGLLFLAQKAYEIAFIYTATWLATQLLKVAIMVAEVKWQGSQQKSKQQFIPFLNDLAMVFILTTAIFVTLGRVFQVDVMALITGLGLGGLALALAARETLENLFASFTIFLDLPFVVGDSIQVGSIQGDVEKIGFRSTKIRAADGNLIMIPNRLLTSQSLENMSERQFRRAKYTLNCLLGTSSEALRLAMQDIEEMILEDPLCKKKAPKVVFEGFGAYALELSVTYFVQTPDFAKFQASKQLINFNILRILEKHGIGLASSASAPNGN